MPQSLTLSATKHGYAGPLLCQGQTRLAALLGHSSVIALVCLSILAPPALQFGPDFPLLKFEVEALPLVFLGYLWLLLAGEARPLRPNGMFVVGALFSLTVAVSICYSSSILGETVILRDFYEFPKFLLPVAFFTLAYEAKLSETAIRRLMRYLGLTLVPICLYAWAQWSNLTFSYWLNNYYKSGENVEAALRYAGRVYSTMGNPNNFSELLTWVISAFVLALLLFPAHRVRNTVIALACLVTLTMTGSRYGLLDTIVALIAVFAMHYAAKGRKLSQLVLPLALLALFAAVFFLVSSSNQRNSERFQTLGNPLQADSFRQRVDVLWPEAIRDFQQSPILGHGPAKNIFTGIITDSEYLNMLKQFGLVGLMIFLAYYLYPLYLVWRGMRSGQRAGPALEESLPGNFLVMRLGFVMIVTSLLMNIGMGTMQNFLLQGFLWMWVGLGVRAARTIGEVSRLSLSRRQLMAGSNPFAYNLSAAKTVR